MTKNRSKKLKLIAATSLSIFSLFVCFVSSFAWFSANRKADTDGNGFVTSAGVSKIKRIDIYPEVSDSETGVSEQDYLYSSSSYCSYTKETGWVSSSSSTLSSPIQLGVYSMEDQTHSVLVLFTLQETLTSYELDIKTTTSFDDSCVKAAENTAANQINETSNPLSSFIDFNYVNLSTALTASSSTYDLSTQIDSDKALSFVNRSDPQNGYETTKTISTTSEDTNYIALIVEYNTTIVNYIFYTLNFENPILDDSTKKIPFTCDWSIDLK